MSDVRDVLLEKVKIMPESQAVKAIIFIMGMQVQDALVTGDSKHIKGQK